MVMLGLMMLMMLRRMGLAEFLSQWMTTDDLLQGRMGKKQRRERRKTEKKIADQRET